MDINAWKKKNNRIRRYTHFDSRLSLEKAWGYINNPYNIVKHGFYPLIHYTQKFIKYNKIDGEKIKEREISYSAHIDRCIFQLYSYKLNCMYNERVLHDGTGNSAIAYRDNLKMNNIHFAKQAFDFIKQMDSCSIMIGDFTKFFDSLDHLYLKKQLCSLLKVEKLPDDYYAVYKNITKFSVWELEDLLKIKGIENSAKGISQFNELDRALTVSEFRRYKKGNLHKNNDNFGIPQGSAISAILSNVYMLEFDKIVNDIVKQQNGLYMRYSDDFIIVLPNNPEKNMDCFKKIAGVIGTIPRLELEPMKTQLYHYESGVITNSNKMLNQAYDSSKKYIDYLGFTFDGKVVAIRDKTLSKYYYRMYRKIKTILKNEGVSSKGNKISNENLYLKYSIKGAYVGKGNFITYVKRAEKIFGKDEAINRGTKKHMKKIKNELAKI